MRGVVVRFYADVRSILMGLMAFQRCDPNADKSKLIEESCFPYGEEVLFEIMGDTPWIPFREYNIPSRDFGKSNATVQPYGCAAAVENFALEAARGPAIACNNDATQNKTMFPSPYGPISWYV